MGKPTRDMSIDVVITCVEEEKRLFDLRADNGFRERRTGLNFDQVVLRLGRWLDDYGIVVKYERVPEELLAQFRCYEFPEAEEDQSKP